MPGGRPTRTEAQQIVLAKLGENIARFRREAGMTQDDLASKLGAGTDRVEVSLAETGKTNISATRVLEYALALGVTPNDLFSELLDG